MSRTLKFFTFPLGILLLSLVAGGCNIKENVQEETNVSITSTVEELGQMNRDFAKFLGENGDTITDKGKYTEVLQRNAEGKWISLYGMWSNNEPMPAH